MPGESYIAALDAFHDRDIARHRLPAGKRRGDDGGSAVGKATGRPGICFVTRGPGATNASAGVHIARQDSTPMILFVGQVARDMREREAFQELDYRAVFGTMAKWATEIDDPARIPELISRAFYTATSGRPGPGRDRAAGRHAGRARRACPTRPPFEPVETWPGPTDMSRLQKLLWAAERPIVLLGGSRWSEAGLRRGRALRRALRAAGRDHVPPRASVRSADHPCYAGDLGIGPNPKLLARVKGADLVLLVGGRLGEMPSQSYTLLDIPGPRQTLVHVHPGVEELGRVYRAASCHQCRADRVCRGARRPAAAERRRAGARKRQIAHADYLAWTDKPTAVPGPVNLGEIVVGLRDELPGRRDHLQRRRQFLHLGAPLFALPPLRHRSSRRPRARWATACRRPSA